MDTATFALNHRNALLRDIREAETVYEKGIASCRHSLQSDGRLAGMQQNLCKQYTSLHIMDHLKIIRFYGPDGEPALEHRMNDGQILGLIASRRNTLRTNGGRVLCRLHQPRLT